MSLSIKPTLGWVVLSDADRAAAERRLAANAAEGTRDELGFGTIHFAYADRFFPGTSVLQTRIRYIWFICWSYQELLRSRASGPALAEALRTIEVRTAKRLLKDIGDPTGSGIIGWTRFRVNAVPVTMPSQIYWNALRLWGVLRPREDTGKSPGQAELHARWGERANESQRKDELAHEKEEPIFIEVPPAPQDWQKKDSKLLFDLTPVESRLIKASWKTASGQSPEPLMSKLAQSGVIPKSMWSRALLNLASDTDKAALMRAQKAASLVCIGRALYAAMIEELKNGDQLDGIQLHQHRDWLEELRVEHSEKAVSLNLKEMAEHDVPKISNELLRLLEKIQAWADSGGSYEKLKASFLERECSLKEARAMLLPPAVSRRAAWQVNQRAEPLNYRWHIVHKFLEDLAT